MKSVNERLKDLRQEMMKENIDAYIVFSSDDHQSEYVAKHFRSRAFISGFDGSAGTVVITKDKACLWTDSRYFIQAEKQLSGSEYIFHKMGEPEVPDYLTWINDNVANASTIGFNGKTISAAQFESFEKKFSAKKFCFNSDHDLVDRIWDERPLLPAEKVFEHDLEYAGEAREDKIARVKKYLEEHKAEYLLISKLDDIAWILNLRGGDIDCNPLFLSYLLISSDKTTLYINEEKLSRELKEKLSNTIEISEYAKVFNDLKGLNKAKVILEKASTNHALITALSECEIIDKRNITTDYKAIKNETEIKGLANSHIQDGVAITKFLYWLKQQKENNVKLTEIDASDKLNSFRAEMKDFHDISFAPISAYGPNGAMCHYSATPENQSDIEYKSLYLIDSGGQYKNGTTDITRTIAMGELTEEEMIDYTLVLKGHIALANAKFPKGTKGYHLDILARQFLWQYGYNYGHGTGHGVGYFLNVHEGPQNISGFPKDIVLEPGMFTSNEPGIYREGKHGVRIENLILVENAEKTEFGEFYKFNTVTVAPLDLTPVKKELLSPEEIKWINEYHQKSRDLIIPFLTKDEADFMKEITKDL